MRELFIEELVEVRGGADPIRPILDKVGVWADWVEDQLVMTTACGEGMPVPIPWC